MNTETNTSPAPRPTLTDILWRFSGSFFVFGALFAGIMAASWSFLLPRYTQIDVGGTMRDAREIRSYKEELTAQIAGKEEERRLAVLAIHDPQYEALKTRRGSRVTLDRLRAEIERHAKDMTERADAIVFSNFEYDPGRKSLTITGDVRNVETRSMTVLAQFSQSLTDLPFVASATTPAFAREESKTGFHSPFTITLTLQ